MHFIERLECISREPQRRIGDDGARRGGDNRSFDAELARHEDNGEQRDPRARGVPERKHTSLLAQFLRVGVLRLADPVVNGQVGYLRDASPDHPNDDTGGEPPVSEAERHEVVDDGEEGIVAIATAKGSLIAARPRMFMNFLNSRGSMSFIIFWATPETNTECRIQAR